MTQNPDTAQAAQQKETEIPLSEDLLRGANEIAVFMFGETKYRRQIYYLTGEAPRGLPHFKMGSVICARKSTIRNWIKEQEGRFKTVA